MKKILRYTSTIAIVLSSFEAMGETMQQDADRTISEFKAKLDDEILTRLVTRIKAEKVSETEHTRFLVQVLKVVDDYLREHPEPQGTPALNIAPSDGSLSGIDPKDVKDPTARAKYESEIAENKKLIEARRKHRAVISVRDEIIAYCTYFKAAKPENREVLKQICLDQKLTEPSANEVLKTGK